MRLGETGRAASRAKALVLADHGLSQLCGSATVKALLANGAPDALAEELARVAAAGKYTSGKIPVIETLLELGDTRRAAEMTHEVIAGRSVFGKDLARMTRVLVLSEGLHAADDIVALLRARKNG
jgi:hypothetical protein